MNVPPSTVPVAAPYADSWEHLAEELERLEILVRAHLADAVASSPEPGPEPLRGLYLSGSEVQRLLNVGEPDSPEARSLLRHAEDLRGRIAWRREASAETGVALRLPTLASRFSLSPMEEQVLVLCLAPELDPRFEKFYAYLNDDLTRKGPTLQLALKLLFADPTERSRARSQLSNQGPLFRAGLIHVADDGPAAGSRLGCVLRIDDRVGDFLSGLDRLPAAIESIARVTAPSTEPRSEFASRVAGAVRGHLEGAAGRRLLVQLIGPPGIGRQSFAETVCADLGTAVLRIALSELAGPPEQIEHTVRLACREALLQPAALYITGLDPTVRGSSRQDGGEESHGRPEPDLRAVLARAIEDFSWLTFLEVQRPFAPTGRWRDHTWLRVPMSPTDETARVQWWRAALADVGAELSETEVGALAGRFRFTPGHVRSALRAARDAALMRAAPDAPLSVRDIAAACRAQAGTMLEGLAHRIEPRYDWDDLVLPAGPLEQLRELVAEVRHRHRVFGEWGFGEKLGRGTGLAALFSGPSSGVGKSMAAEIIAGDLELDLYRIDLSSVVSKYIGETEKNLARIFAEAERGAAVLLFDEADALFGKRSEVKDAHDRYANIEISYLLQRIEEYEGVAILTTNLKANIDDAFLRRLQFLVDFPFPDVEQRRRIWTRLFPARAPRSADVDLEFLAERLPLAGGNIRNIVLHAAFLAAADGGVIGMPQLMRAAKREYDKIGHLGGPEDFGPYWALVTRGDRGR